eukprot:8738899-Pyramimonas_sp.AAC.1
MHLADHWGKVHQGILGSVEDRQQLQEFVQTCPPPPNIFWKLGRLEFGELISRAGDSCPGPDSIPYACYARGGAAVVDSLYALYSVLLEQGYLPPKFNRGMAVFLAKGSGPDDTSSQIIRKPETTRPITLSNSDNKGISLAINRSLSQIAPQTVLANQRGVIPGRYMNENIIDLESRA